MVESRVPNQRQPRPLANCEVKNLLEMHLSSRAQTTNPSDNALGQESGNELRQQTMDYIELFNDFELRNDINDIRQ